MFGDLGIAFDPSQRLSRATNEAQLVLVALALAARGEHVLSRVAATHVLHNGVVAFPLLIQR